jgi:hypothetical protein
VADNALCIIFSSLPGSDLLNEETGYLLICVLYCLHVNQYDMAQVGRNMSY